MYQTYDVGWLNRVKRVKYHVIPDAEELVNQLPDIRDRLIVGQQLESHKVDFLYHLSVGGNTFPLEQKIDQLRNLANKLVHGDEGDECDEY